MDKFIVRLGMSKSEAAKHTGVETSTLTRVINGESQLTVALAAKLEKHLNAPVDLLFRMDAAAKVYQVKKILETESSLSNLRYRKNSWVKHYYVD